MAWRDCLNFLALIWKAMITMINMVRRAGLFAYYLFWIAIWTPKVTVERQLAAELGCETICPSCERILQGERTLTDGDPDAVSNVHKSWQDVVDSAIQRCILCAEALEHLATGIHDETMVEEFTMLDDFIFDEALPFPQTEKFKRAVSMFDTKYRYNMEADMWKLEIKMNVGAQDVSSSVKVYEWETADELASRLVTDMSAGSESVLVLCKHWYTSCRDHGCDREMTWTPKRLLFLQPSLATLVDGVQCEYATLSHCWGNDPFMTLNSHTEVRLRGGLAIDSFDATFRDAMTVALSLGISYIWIDSYCIIQDSIEDWEAESKTMGLVYTHSVLNIAATGSAGPSEGLFKPVVRPRRRYVPIQIDGKRFKIWSERSLNFEKRDEPAGPLTSRAWFRQEAWLCTRMLHFAKNGLWWQCKAFPVLSESLRYGNPLESYMASEVREDFTKKFRSVLEEWAMFLARYTPAQLTFPAKDKVRAAEGVLGSTVHGHPEDHFIPSLLWESTRFSTPLAGQTSWSWASRNGALDFSTARNIYRPVYFMACLQLQPLILIGRLLRVTQISVPEFSGPKPVEWPDELNSHVQAKIDEHRVTWYKAPCSVMVGKLRLQATMDDEPCLPLYLLPVMHHGSFKIRDPLEILFLVLQANRDGTYSRCGTAKAEDGYNADWKQTVQNQRATIVVLA